MTPYQQRQADKLRSVGFGDRRIATKLGLTRHAVRIDRETRLNGFEPEQAASEHRVPGFKHVVLISDTQYPWVHTPSEEAVKDYIDRTNPDQLIQIGDFADMFMLARFDKKRPSFERPEFIEEVALVRERAKWWREGRNQDDDTLIEGNHEARINRYLEIHADEFYGLDELRIENLLGFTAAGWNYLSPYGAGMWVGLPGGLWVTHGEIARKWSGASAKANVMEKYGHSVACGHTHRLSAFYHTRQSALGSETIAGYEIGCLCDPETTPRSTSLVDWQHGFGIGWVSETSPRYHLDLVSINNGGFVSGGIKYGE